jgi:hypothetical protein
MSASDILGLSYFRMMHTLGFSYTLMHNAPVFYINGSMPYLSIEN